tara:strand:- start:1115 stop:1510 length:396 start_codon:yes stop_codon:yes gene_type:complete
MSDLKITSAGVVQTQDRHGPINPVAKLGQAGSMYTAASGEAINPPLNQAFVAITMITDCTFDSGEGLIAEDSTKFINTEVAAHDLTAGAETSTQGTGGQVVDSVVFTAGITIYGRWTEIDVATGSCLAYIG